MTGTVIRAAAAFETIHSVYTVSFVNHFKFSIFGNKRRVQAHGAISDTDAAPDAGNIFLLPGNIFPGEYHYA